MGIKVAHVEAGLRSFDKTMPEETNRIRTDEISDFLFTTEESGNKNLLNEIAPDGISSDPKIAKQIAETIYHRMIQEAETMVAEGICEARFLDLACILGAGITPNRGGLLGIK